jgi:small subunit ribosomal protein S1
MAEKTGGTGASAAGLNEPDASKEPKEGFSDERISGPTERSSGFFVSDGNRTVPDEPTVAEPREAVERPHEAEPSASVQQADSNAVEPDVAGKATPAAPEREEIVADSGGEAGASSESAEVAAATGPDQAASEPAAGEQSPSEPPSGEQAASVPTPAAAGGSKRKRKKKKKQAAEGAEGADKGAEEKNGKAKAKDASHLPFIRFLSGGASSKRHFFAVGEIVAGRVLRCEAGSIVVDLFGKATAIADELEPREVQLPEQVEAETGRAPVAGETVATETGDDSSATSEPAETSAQEPGAVVPAEAEAVESAAAESPSEEREQVSAEAELQVDDRAQAEEQPSGDEEISPATEAGRLPEAGDEPSTEAEGAVAAPSFPPAATGEQEIEVRAHEPEGQDESAGAETVEAEPVEGDSPQPPLPQTGSIFRGRIGAIAESGHVGIVNRWIDAGTVRSQIEALREQRKRVRGVVFGFNRGGFDVLVDGIRAFCPASGMSLEEIDDPRRYIGQKLEFTLPVAKGGSEVKDLVVSRRSILEKENRKRIKELLRSLQPGQKIRGKVTQIREYGLFVDIGGVDGLVHQSELSYAFGVKPQEVAQVGDEVDVQVIKVGSDGEAQKERVTRVNLSIKALLPDPWDTHANAVAEGSVQKGKVTRTTEFGAFIELAPSIEGLLHVTELGRELKHANQAVKEGDEIYVVVERADRRQRRISLSKLSAQAVKEFEEGKLEEVGRRPPSLQPGARIKVKIETADHRGLTVRVVGAAGKRGRGYIPGSETGKERGTDLRKAFPAGTELEVKVIGVDRDGGLKCSVKALAIDDERRAVREYRREAAKQGFGTFGDLLRAKLGDAGRE